MNRAFLLLVAVVLAAIGFGAQAQTAQQVVTGYLSQSGCPSVALTPCFVPFGGGSTYNTIAASQTAQVLSATSGGTTGATGDYLSFCEVFPTTTSPGVVTILDNATSVFAFPGGASSLSNLVPFPIPVGALSVSGAWKITTGAGLSVVCVGRFH